MIGELIGAYFAFSLAKAIFKASGDDKKTRKRKKKNYYHEAYGWDKDHHTGMF